MKNNALEIITKCRFSGVGEKILLTCGIMIVELFKNKERIKFCKIFFRCKKILL